MSICAFPRVLYSSQPTSCLPGRETPLCSHQSRRQELPGFCPHRLPAHPPALPCSGRLTVTCDPGRLATLPANFSLSKGIPGVVRAQGCVGQMGLGGLALAYPRRQSRWAAPSTPSPHLPHYASLGWSWSQMVGMGRPCSLWPDKGSCVLSLPQR